MQETTIDVQKLLSIIVRRARFIIGFFLVVMTGTLLINAVLPRVYEAEITLRVKPPKSLADSLLAGVVSDGTATNQLMLTHAEIIKSHTVAENVLARLPANRYANFTADQIVQRITTIPGNNSEILKIRVQGSTPGEAEDVANSLISAFAERITDMTRMEQKSVREFIGQRLLEAKGDLEKAESALERYKREQKIVAPEEERKALIETHALMQKYAAENDMALVGAQEKVNEANRQLGKQSPGYLADNEVLKWNKAKLVDAEVERSALLQKFTPEHPKVKSVQSVIDNIKETMREETEKIVRGDSLSFNTIHQNLVLWKLQAELELYASNVRKISLERTMSLNQRQLGEFPAKEHGLAVVLRDVTVAQEKYTMLAKRHEEARISEVMQPTDVQVIDSPIVSPVPVKPRVGANIFLGAIIGIAGGVALAFLREYTQRHIQSEADIKEYLDIPVIGSIPDFSDQPVSIYRQGLHDMGRVFRWLRDF